MDRGQPLPSRPHLERLLCRAPLWQTAWKHGIVFGTSAATWQLEDPDYAQLVEHEAAILFTEDDLLWWRLRPTPDSALDFQYADQFMVFAERNRQLVLGAHLVWDEGFGEGWTEEDLWGWTRGPRGVSSSTTSCNPSPPTTP